MRKTRTVVRLLSELLWDLAKLGKASPRAQPMPMVMNEYHRRFFLRFLASFPNG